MTKADVAAESIRLSFEAKKRQHQACPDFFLSKSGPLTWLHGVPGWYEVDAFYARDLPPLEVVAAVRATDPHPHHMITVLTGEALPKGGAEEYARLGYRPLPEAPQPLMSKSLRAEPSLPSAHDIHQGEEGTDTLTYHIVSNGKVACTAKRVWASPQTIYVFAMETHHQHRRTGMGSALLARLHADAVNEGAVQSILWSSLMGRPFYGSFGYSPVVTGHSFIPSE